MTDIILKSGEANPSDIRLIDVAAAIVAVAVCFSNCVVPHQRTLLYPSIAEPLPVPVGTGNGNVLFSTTNAIIPHSRTLLYPSIADVVKSETVTVDKWLAALSTPSRRKTVYQQDGLFFVGSDTARDHKWYVPLSEPIRRKASPTLQQPFVGSDIATDSRWFVPLSEPVRRRTPVQPDGLSLVKADPFPETVSIDRWQQPLSEPVRWRGQRPDKQDEFFFVGSDTARDALWFTPLSEPVRRKIVAQPDAFSSSYVATPTEEITVDKWLAPLGLPTLRKVVNQPDALSLIRSDVSRDTWAYSPLSEPIRRKVVVQPDGLSLHPFPITVANYQWLMPLSEPVRWRGQRPDKQDELFFVGSDTATDARWFTPLSEPVRRKIVVEFPAFSWAYFTPASTEVITPDKWFVELSSPVRIKPGLLVTQQQATFLDPFPQTVAGFQWQQPLSEPVRGKVRASLPASVEPIFDQTRLDSWFRPLSEPTRRTSVANLTSFFEPPFISTPIVAWVLPLSEPVRRLVSVANQPTFFEPPTDLRIVVDMWVPRTEQPPRGRSLPTSEQQAFFFVGSDTARDARWFAPLSEPTRRKLIVEQPAEFWPYYNPPSTEIVTVDKWQVPLNQPIRIVRVVEFPAEFWSYFTPDTPVVTTVPVYMAGLFSAGALHGHLGHVFPEPPKV